MKVGVKVQEGKFVLDCPDDFKEYLMVVGLLHLVETGVLTEGERVSNLNLADLLEALPEGSLPQA